MKTDLFQSYDHCWVFQICCHIKCSTLTALSFRIWNNLAGILSPPLALLIMTLSKVHLTSHTKVSASNDPLVFLTFLKRFLVFPILLLSSISSHCSPRKAFLSLLAILWNSPFRWVYLSFSRLPLASLLLTAICKASSNNHLPFCVSFYFGWFWSLPLVQCYEPLSKQTKNYFNHCKKKQRKQNKQKKQIVM